ncbi:hypothetical protein M413DRAFT_26148 [Hebeloma cylindrosporum]|uniref:Uncharacterized protein n=1 Tax=Hebeloma cylindrosporum TaxID=76867 RepID=A0A0C2Y1X7_HEBCY|nr:hypothetical protein M413DRAFT_26148 [Hebeloma cylindrosporum h7]
MSVLGDQLYSLHKKLRKDLGERLDSLRPASSSSEIINNSTKLLTCDAARIHLGRPGGAPVAIFNPALATLQHHLDQVQVTSADVYNNGKYIKEIPWTCQ